MLFDAILSIIAPHECLGCGQEGDLWCPACRRLCHPAVERCYRCHRLSPGGRTCPGCRRQSALYAVHAVTPYDGCAKQLIWKLKFEGAQAAAGVVAGLMRAAVIACAPDCIAAVPTATSHIRRRGYDQAQLIVRRLSQVAALPALACLIRTGQQQQRDASRQQRLTQLQHAFRVPASAPVHGAHILLIDDVLTTGATLEAAAQTLKAAGAKRVSALVFAQA